MDAPQPAPPPEWMAGKGGAGTQIGAGWTGFDTVLAPGDWLGDGAPDLLGVSPGGMLDRYPTDGSGHWTAASGEQIGQGRQTATALF